MSDADVDALVLLFGWDAGCSHG